MTEKHPREMSSEELIADVKALPDPQRSILSHNERVLIELCQALAAKLEKPLHDNWKGVTVVLDGGLVQDVTSNDPRMVGLGYDVIDYDTDGADDCGVVKQADGSFSDAFLGGGYISQQTVEIVIEDEADTSESLTAS